MANELSPMAGETFAFNILGDNLSELSRQNKSTNNVLWIKSKYKSDNLKERLRENPFEYNKGRYSDIDSTTDFKRKLIIGNIDHFLKFLIKNKNICRQIRKENIDVLSGGPPCQGFSLAGKRVKDDHKNLLPLSFAKFAGLVKPKVVILENVKGITAPFETTDGIKHYAWLEVAKAFSLKGFVPICMLVNSKYFGVPQNRPRFILLAFREDIFNKIKERDSNNDITTLILLESQVFFNKVRKKRKKLEDIKTTDLKIHDMETDPEFFEGSILPMRRNDENSFVKASEAISDISNTNRVYKLDNIQANYPSKLGELFKSGKLKKPEVLKNHEPRKHSFKVQARFRLFQILNGLNGLRQDAVEVFTGKSQNEETIRAVYNAIREESVLINDGGMLSLQKLRSLQFFKEYLKELESKKHSQRAIKKNEPAPAQMTIPDDLCHYSSTELRTLTVREMARFQSFPDWFIFRSKVTTGGKQRSFEVPQYTQVGNAVPPILAHELGKTIGNLLNSIQ
jgi:DNA (cytosine-5)-methyltransferase 1